MSRRYEPPVEVGRTRRVGYERVKRERDDGDEDQWRDDSRDSDQDIKESRHQHRPVEEYSRDIKREYYRVPKPVVQRPDHARRDERGYNRVTEPDGRPIHMREEEGDFYRASEPVFLRPPIPYTRDRRPEIHTHNEYSAKRRTPTYNAPERMKLPAHHFKGEYFPEYRFDRRREFGESLQHEASKQLLIV
jgi:hypothetical protein